MARAAGQYGAGFNCWNPVEQFVRQMMNKKGAANSRLFKSNREASNRVDRSHSMNPEGLDCINEITIKVITERLTQLLLYDISSRALDYACAQRLNTE
jgi:hypothetical protein